MTLKKWIGMVAGLAAFASAPMAGSTPATRIDPITWSIDASRSEARFTVTKLGFENVTGVFRESEGEIRYDPEHGRTVRVRLVAAVVRR